MSTNYYREPNLKMCDGHLYVSPIVLLSASTPQVAYVASNCQWTV